MSQLPDNQPPSDELFSQKSLTLSVELIGDNNPGLADAIKKAMDQISTTAYTDTRAGDGALSAKSSPGEMYFNAQLLETLQAHTIGKIISALTDLGEQALQNRHLTAEYLTLLRHLINDWARLTEWILKNSANYKSPLH